MNPSRTEFGNALPAPPLRHPRLLPLAASLLASLAGGGTLAAGAYAGGYQGQRSRPMAGGERASIAGTGTGAAMRAELAAADAQLVIASGREPLPSVTETSHCVGDEITLTISTLIDEPFSGSETVDNPDGSGLSLKEAIGLALVCAQDARLVFHQSLAGGVLRRATAGPLIPVASGAGRLTIDGDINGNGRADIVLTMRQQNAGGAPSPGDNPNINVLIPVDAGDIIDPPDVSPVWPTDRLVNIQGADRHLQLRNLAVFDSPFHSMMFVNGALATLEVDNVLFTGNHPSVSYSYFFQVEGGSQVSVRNSAFIANPGTFRFNGYYTSGAIEVLNSTITAVSPDYSYGVFLGGTTLVNSIVLGRPVGSISPASHHNLTSGEIADVLEIHPDGTPSFRLLADPDNPAIDAGDNAAAAGLSTDLMANPRLFDGNGDLLATVDLGAFELQQAVTERHPVGGTVSGLLGSGLVLHNNGGDDLPVASDGVFEFSALVPDGATYAVTVAGQPTAPVQTCAVANGSGTIDGAAVTDVMITCDNSPPVADAGGPYFGQEGIALTLDGAGSDDADGDIVAYHWDLDYDGVDFDVDATGITPDVTFPDDGSYTIALRLTDSIGNFDIAATTVEIANVAPVVNAGPNQFVLEGELVALAPATFIDPGIFDTHEAVVDWGDGSGLQPATIDQANMTVSASHTYADDGDYTVFVVVFDGTHIGIGSFFVTVSDVTPPQVLTVGTLPDPGDGSLDEDEYTTATIDRLTLAFDDRMMSTGTGSAAAADNFRLVADGGGGIGTASCSADIAPGDEVITIDGASYNGGTRTTTLMLNGGATLPDGRYRLFACANLIDTGGNTLDGNGDGGGGDFVRNFAIDRSPPSDPLLTSISHDVSDWSNDNQLVVEWSGALDAIAGIEGYAVVFDEAPLTDPGTTITVAHGTDPQQAGSTVTDGSHWFHLRACDVLGNCGVPLHLGPFLIDTVMPIDPILSSPSHTPGTWSREPVLELSWSGASDAASDVAGYSIQLDAVSDSQPPDGVGVPHHIDPHTLSEALDDADDHWFHLRTCDVAGNCGPAQHLGPFLIDSTAPEQPTAFDSSSHQVGSISGNRFIDIAWSGASDAGSGIAGYAWHWSEQAEWLCDEQIDGGPASSAATSPQLASGDWHAHLCVGDVVGNWSDVVSIGPFTIDATGPRVLGYDSVADTGDGILENGEETDAGITQILVQFDERLEPTTVTAESFRLLHSGADGLFDSADCNPPAGDDIAIEPLFALSGPGDTQAAIGPVSDQALPQGHYRLIACPTLTDPYGNGLDGQDSGSPAPAWIDFVVTVSNPVRNPNFDFDIAGWQFSGDGAAPSHMPPLISGSWSSGSLRVLGVAESEDSIWLASQCVPVPGDTREISATVHATIAGGLTETYVGYQLFAGTTCANAPLSAQLSTPVVGTTPGWQKLTVPVAGPSGGRSVLMTLLVQPQSKMLTEVLFDDVSVLGHWDLIFSNDFESNAGTESDR